MDEQKVNKTFSIYPTHIAVIMQVAKDHGYSSLSAALRFIITDWVRRVRAEMEARQVEPGTVTP